MMSVSLPRNGSEWHSESLFLFFVARKGIPSCVLFPRMIWNGIPRFASILFPRNRIPSCVLFCRRVRNRIISVCFYFWFEILSYFFFAERFGTEFRDFVFRGTTGILSEITICSIYSIFRRIIFLSEIPNPNSAPAYWSS
jgi:hypothetical protein